MFLQTCHLCPFCTDKELIFLPTLRYLSAESKFEFIAWLQVRESLCRYPFLCRGSPRGHQFGTGMLPWIAMVMPSFAPPLAALPDLTAY